VVDLDEDKLCTPVEFGEQLRRIRESTGLRIEDIVAETKVSKAIFNAMEEGSFHLLPERVFSRSFVAQYAKTLGVSEKPLLEAFDQAWEEYSTSSGIHLNLEEVTDHVGSSIRWRFWIPITAGILILLGAAAVILRGSTSLDDGLAPDPRRSGVRRTAEQGERQRALAPTPRLQPTVITQRPVETEMIDLTVAVETGEECWIHYRDREGMTGQSLLTNGEELELELAGPVKLTIGNAGAVRMVIGGRMYSDLGLPGQVIHTEVSSDGVTRLGHSGADDS
jgi:cytoskeletal protein RodZ